MRGSPGQSHCVTARAERTGTKLGQSKNTILPRRIRREGVTAEEQHLTGTPAPDTYLAAATVLNVQPGEAAVFEEAPSGVNDDFVVGVDRVGQVEQLRAQGADRILTDLAQLLDHGELA